MKDVISVDEILENLTFEVIKWNYGASSAECGSERLKSKKLLHSLLISKLPEKKNDNYVTESVLFDETKGYNSAIDDVKSVLDELFGVQNG